MSNIALYCDDCFNVLPTIEKKSIDLVIVDLPYGQTNCAWDTKIDLESMWRELKRISKEKTAFIFFTTTKFGNDLINSNKKWFKYDIVWVKKNSVGFLLANKMPLRKHEMIYVFYKKLPTYNPQKTYGHSKYSKHRSNRKMKDDYIYGDVSLADTDNTDGSRFPVSIIYNEVVFNQHDVNYHHTQKPIDVLEYLIKTYSNEGDLILDFTMGVGTTGLACKNTNRNFIGIERDVAFFDKCLVKENR